MFVSKKNNKMKRLISILMFLPLVTKSQNELKGHLKEQEGISFVQGISWQEVIKKAKEEGKSIFVDCYTTWCLPCKKMDKEVFSDEQVAQFFNSKFICYKLQMDSTRNDDQAVKDSYRDADYFRKAY